MELDKDLRSIQEVRGLIAQARRAQSVLERMSQADLDKITAAISAAGADHAGRLGDMAVEETGFGVKEDKELKNRFAALTLYEAIKDERTHGILAEDREKRTIDIGVPRGHRGRAGALHQPHLHGDLQGHDLYEGGQPHHFFSPSQRGKLYSGDRKCGPPGGGERRGPGGGHRRASRTPTLEATNELMRHDHTRLILATGGGAMVKAAYSSGTPAIGVGAGNGPAYIHKSADVALAVKRILDSKTFDNGTVCASEQSIVVTREMDQAVTAELQRQGAWILPDGEHRKLSKFILRANGTMNPAIVGKSVELWPSWPGWRDAPGGPGAGGPGDRRGPGLSLFQREAGSHPGLLRGGE